MSEASETLSSLTQCKNPYVYIYIYIWYVATPSRKMGGVNRRVNNSQYHLLKSCIKLHQLFLEFGRTEEHYKHIVRFAEVSTIVFNC